MYVQYQVVDKIFSSFKFPLPSFFSDTLTYPRLGGEKLSTLNSHSPFDQPSINPSTINRTKQNNHKPQLATIKRQLTF